MPTETKRSDPLAHQPAAAPAQPPHPSAAWQVSMNTAFATFLQGIQTQLLQAGQLIPRPIVLSYADMPKENFEGKAFSLPKAASQLAGYFSAASLQIILNPINPQVPQDSIALLQNQLAQHPETQVIVLSTPAYQALADQDNQLLHRTLVDFGEGKKDSLLLLMCLGGSSVASQIIPRHFLFREGKSLLREFDGPNGGMPAFLDMFGELSGKSGLGLLPDLLDLESTHSPHQPIYAALFTGLSQTQARLTTDHALEENLDAQFNTHPLHGHYPDTQGLHTDSEEKYDDVVLPELLSDFLSDPKAKTALLFAPTPADTELSGLAVVQALREQSSHPRVMVIDLAQYPGRAAHHAVALTLRHTLKLSSPIIQHLKDHSLGEEMPRLIVFVFKNYQHTGAYDNLYIQNALANWPDAKVLVTCSQDYFNRHDPALCFLSDPASPDRSSLRQVILAGCATQAAQAAALHLAPQPIENLDALLADSGLTPKRQAQQIELDRFLDQIRPLTNIMPPDARNTFISYAWEPAAKDLARQQRHLRQIAQDLGRVGFPTWLDIERMTGDINTQMAQNIQNSRYALIIGTPRYTQRATVLLNGQPTNVKREYDDILQGHQDKRLEVLALSFLPEGQFDGGKADDTGKTEYPSFPDTLPQDIPNFNLLAIEDAETYIQCLTDEQHGLLPRLLHLAERSPEEQQTYQAAKVSLEQALALLPAQHLIVAQAEQDQRIYEVPQRRSLYIEARGKAENKDDSREFGLTAQFDAFLSREVEESKDENIHPSQATTFVALGEGGSGKSLFSQIQYARLLEQWQQHKENPADTPRPAWIPLYIPLKHYVGKHEDTPENQAAGRVGKPRVNTCVETALRTVYRLDDSDMAMLKTGSGQGLGVLLILDGFDELGGETPHLYVLNKLDQWTCPLKLLITSRVDYIPDPDKHKDYFTTAEHRFIRSYLQPFSAEDIQRYIQLYEAQVLIQQSQAQAARDIASGVLSISSPLIRPLGTFSHEGRRDESDTYQTLAALPGLLELVKNPFLLNLVLQGLPYLLAERRAGDKHPVTRLAIYDSFSQYWFGKEVYRLVKRDDPDLRLHFEQHAERLAFQLFLNQQLSVSQRRPEDTDLWAAFFDISHPAIAKARAALPLRDAGNQQYEFMHRTLFEYFCARHFIYAHRRALSAQHAVDPTEALGHALAARPPEHKLRRVVGVPLPVQDAGVFGFLGDAIAAGDGEGSFKAALFEQIIRSSSHVADAEGWADFSSEPPTGPLGLAAAHAATILTKTGVSMGNQAWSGVQLPGADLGLAYLANTDLSGSNLQAAYLVGTFLFNANLSRANLVGVRFMEFPKINFKDWVNCLALYPSHTALQDKPWIAVGVGNEILMVNRDTKEILWKGVGHENKVTCIAFSPTGGLVVSGSHDNTLCLWAVGETSTGDLSPQAVLRGHTDEVTACAFSPTDGLVVSGSHDNTLCLWAVGETSTGDLSPQAVLRGHTGYVTACAFSPSGACVVSGSYDETLRLWAVGETSTGDLSPQAVLRGHGYVVNACAFSPLGTCVVSGSSDRTLRLWAVGESSTGDLSSQAVLRGHEEGVTACAFSPSGMCVVSGSHDKTLRLWAVGESSTGDLSPQAVLRGHENWGVTACAFSPSGAYVVSAGRFDKTLRLWAVGEASNEDLSPQAMLCGHTGYVTACAFSPSGAYVVSGSETLRLWAVGEASTGDLSPQPVLRGHKNYVTACAFSPAGGLVVSGSHDNTLCLWAVGEASKGNLSPQAVLRGHTEAVRACAFSPSGAYMVSGSNDETLRLWAVGEVSKGDPSPQAVLRGHEREVTACAFSPTGGLVVSGSGGNTLRLWTVGEASTGDLSPQAVLRGHKNYVTSCAFSPSGACVVSGSYDNTLLLWAVGEASTGDLSPQTVLRGHEWHVTTCAFSPSGAYVVSGSRDKTLRLWDVSNIKKVRCVQVVPWFAEVSSIGIDSNYLLRAPTRCQASQASAQAAKCPESVSMVVGDGAGLLSFWALEDSRLRFVGMPPQPGMANVWRETWKSVNLAGTQVTGSVKALLEQYSGKTLKEGVEDNQVRLVAEVVEAKAEALPVVNSAVPVGNGSLAAAAGVFKASSRREQLPTSLQPNGEIEPELAGMGKNKGRGQCCSLS